MSSSEAKLSPTGQDNSNEGSVGADDQKKKERKEKSIWRCFSRKADPTLEEEEGVHKVSSGWVATAKQGSNL